jgi:hypothetical protein
MSCMWASVAIKVVKKDASFIVTTTNFKFYAYAGLYGYEAFCLDYETLRK